MDKDALYAAALAGDDDAISKLEMEADRVDYWDETTILHNESENGNTERVRFILREFAHKNLLVKTSNFKHTALHLAIYSGHTEVAELLIDAARHLPVTSFQAFLRQAGDKDMDTALHAAVMEGNASIVKLLVEADPSDTHIQNDEGKTPMYIAVENGLHDIVEIISTTCTAPSLDGPDGSTVVLIKNLDQGKSPGGTLYKIMDRYAFFVAAIGGDADAIAKLEMQAGILNGGEETILHVVSQNTYADHVRFILREFAKKYLLEKLDDQRRTVLHLAAYDGHTEVAEVLIDAARHLPPPSASDITHDNPVTSFQAFLRQADEDLNTALHRAVMEGHASIVKLLVEADPSDTHIQNDKGKTPMYIAVEKGLHDIVEIISTICTAPSMDGPDGRTAVRIKNLDQAKSPGGTLYKIMDRDALYAAAISGDADAIANLEMEADRLNDNEETILHVESRKGNTERVRFILREFANKNLLVKLADQKETALAPAAYFGHTEVAEVLIDAARHLPPSSANDNPVTSFQAFLRHADQDSETALHVAVKQGHVAIAKLLVEADPSDKHTQNNQGKTPIFIAVERGYMDIVKVICTTCTALTNLDGPGGSTTALHAAIKNLDKAARKEDRGGDVIRLIIEAVKRANNHLHVYEKDSKLAHLFNRTDEKRCIILELAVEGNYLDVVELILAQNPAYHSSTEYSYPDVMGIMPLIYKSMDKGYDDMFNLLTEGYQRGVQNAPPWYEYEFRKLPELISAIRVHQQGYDDMFNLLTEGYQRGVRNRWSYEFIKMPELISAICARQQESVISILYDDKKLVTFADNLGWTSLHHAAYHEFNSIIGKIVEEQTKFEHAFVYEDMVSTPFHVAAEKGYTSTVILLMQLWPSSSSAYTAVDKNGQNILHLAALQSKKVMIQGILKNCSEEYKNALVNKQDNHGNTPLHLLIQQGCLVPEIFKYRGLDIWVQNKENWTAPDMLYCEDQIIDDQAQIKIALDSIQIDQTRAIFSSSVLSSKRERKDVILDKQAKRMIHEKYERMKVDTDAFANCFADAIAGDPISKAALEKKADILNEEEKTILHVESLRGYTERVRFIVREFANKNLLVKLDNQKETALHLAAHHGHIQVVEVLIDAARHIPVSSFQDFVRQATGPMGNTALHLAVLNGNVAIVKLLVEADPNDSHVPNNEGKTPIYIAAEKGYMDIVKVICTTCTALSLDGPGGGTALHALIQNIGQVTQGAGNIILRMMVDAAKRWTSAKDPSLVNFKALFSRTDESGFTALQFAVEKNLVEAVKLILPEDPAYQPGPEIKRNGLMRLIFKAIDIECSDDIIKLLSETYKAGILDPVHKDVLALILAIQKLDEGSVLRHLRNAKQLVTFKEDNGWTPLHYAVYHEFDSILGAIIKAQKDVGHSFEYGNMESTPFYVAVNNGCTSTLVRLMELWPDSASVAANSPYTVVNDAGQNILHLAAASSSRNEMVQGILKYCPEKYKDEILKQQDNDGNTPLHLLFSHGCFIPGLIKHKGLETNAKNKKYFTPRDMLYVEDGIVEDQVHIKIALDDVQTNQSVPKLWGKRTLWGKRPEKKTDMWKCNTTPPSKRKKKDGKFEKGKKILMDKEHEQKKKDLETYKMRTNTQIIVTALITTVTFTVGFTMPGGLHQSKEDDEGLVVLSGKRAFNVFMVSDALALLMSTSSLFFYFLESMNEDPRQVSLLNASSTVLNILSIMAMMLTFIAGTYVVLSDSPVLAIGVCIIGSLFFLLIVIVWIFKIIYDRRG